MKTLFLIPARGGSKGIPRKNIKEFGGKPLIYYSINVARELTSDENICVSTDDKEIIDVVKSIGLQVPFIRPKELATDRTTSNDVIRHALEFYKSKGVEYDVTVLLQPTSPLRTSTHVKEAMSIYTDKLDMVVSVKKSDVSVVLKKENELGYLINVFDLPKDCRRQEALQMYEVNGAVYVINNESLLKSGIANFTRVKKYLMDDSVSIDIDNMTDWEIAEYFFKK